MSAQSQSAVPTAASAAEPDARPQSFDDLARSLGVRSLTLNREETMA
ncbi:amino acid synthesis family protein, partial [Burkholderia multivorans]